MTARLAIDRDDLTGATLTGPQPDRQNLYGTRAVVVATREESPRLEKTDADASSPALTRTPTALCCPVCGQPVRIYDAGSPAVLTQWRGQCSACEAPLRRWWTVAVDAAYTGVVTSRTLTQMVQATWNERLWAGVTNAREQVRQREFTERVETAAAAFGWDWELSCPLCRRPVSAVPNGGLDYHHWSERPDVGVTLCRPCHDAISWATYDEEIAARAHEWGLRGRNDAQVLRLVVREALATEGVLAPSLADRLVPRYNLVQSRGSVEALIDSLLADQRLQDVIFEAGIADGLSAADRVHPA